MTPRTSGKLLAAVLVSRKQLGTVASPTMAQVMAQGVTHDASISVALDMWNFDEFCGSGTTQ